MQRFQKLDSKDLGLKGLSITNAAFEEYIDTRVSCCFATEPGVRVVLKLIVKALACMGTARGTGTPTPKLYTYIYIYIERERER